LAGFPICAESVYYVNDYFPYQIHSIHAAGSCWWWWSGKSLLISQRRVLEG